jgi:hypothetical protein
MVDDNRVSRHAPDGDRLILQHVRDRRRTWRLDRQGDHDQTTASNNKVSANGTIAIDLPARARLRSKIIRKLSAVCATPHAGDDLESGQFGWFQLIRIPIVPLWEQFRNKEFPGECQK